MFTGLIQGQGEVVELRKCGTECRLSIRPLARFARLADGESIAINGACLSVEQHDAAAFTAYASAETLVHTTLGALKPGDMTNLERALALGDRLGGHMVSGHVDCLAQVQAIDTAGQSLRCRLTFPQAFGVGVVAKGSVALDGISLTVNDCGADFLEVNVIPDTRRRTTVRLWRPGTQVNMETDIIGKYVQRILGGLAAADGGRRPAPGTGLTRELLARSGFL